MELGGTRVYMWLRMHGVPEDLARRALRLAQKAIIARLARDEATVLVPSQRLHSQHPVHRATHWDLLDIVEGRQPRHVDISVGKLPEDQQFYTIKITREGATCQCPLTRLAGAPLCVHRLAAAALLYEKNRMDLLEWLPEAAKRYTEWLLKRKRGRRTARPTHAKPLPLNTA